MPKDQVGGNVVDPVGMRGRNSHAERTNDGEAHQAVLHLAVPHQFSGGHAHSAAQWACVAIGAQIRRLLAGKEKLAGGAVQEALERVILLVLSSGDPVLVAVGAQIVVRAAQALVAVVDQPGATAAIAVHVPVDQRLQILLVRAYRGIPWRILHKFQAMQKLTISRSPSRKTPLTLVY